AEVLADATDGPYQLLAQGRRAAAEVGGNRYPLVAQDSLLGNVAFLGGQLPVQLADQLLARHDLAWAGGTVQQGIQDAVPDVVCEPAPVASVRLVPAGLVPDLVARHGDQEFQQFLGAVQAEAPGGRTEEESSQDGLADVRGIED